MPLVAVEGRLRVVLAGEGEAVLCIEPDPHARGRPDCALDLDGCARRDGLPAPDDLAGID